MDFEARSCGGSFQSPFHGRSHDSFRIRLHFFRILFSGFEQCVLDGETYFGRCLRLYNDHSLIVEIMFVFSPQVFDEVVF